MDSTLQTLQHIKAVQDTLSQFANLLLQRGVVHDESKLSSPEKDYFDKYIPELQKLEYGSDEYKSVLVKMREGVSMHYTSNSHHPEHYENGINGMDLLDLVEMVVDWKAASSRHENSNFFKSIEINEARFNIDSQLMDIIKNTATKLGW